MTEHTCPFGDYREELLLGFLYDDLDSPTRGEFESHLDGCLVCRQELDGLRTVRRQLATWTPPTFGRESRVGSRAPGVESPGAGLRSRWHTIPAWAQVAAALLFLGISAGLANLDVHYDRSGLTIRTGWSTPAATTASAAPVATGNQAPWKADLTALERQLRSEMQAAAQPAHATTTATDADTLRRVRALIADSEKAQQRELALRVAEVMRDVDTQRRADLSRISENLGQLRTNTGMEVLKQRQLLNYLVSVSQKQQ